jgi:GDPmannose 4,6-dehydratase
MEISEELYRPAEVDLLYGDSLETIKLLNWKPKVSFNELIKKMVDNDIKLLKK